MYKQQSRPIKASNSDKGDLSKEMARAGTNGPGAMQMRPGGKKLVAKKTAATATKTDNLGKRKTSGTPNAVDHQMQRQASATESSMQAKV